MLFESSFAKVPTERIQGRQDGPLVLKGEKKLVPKRFFKEFEQCLDKQISHSH